MSSNPLDVNAGEITQGAVPAVVSTGNAVNVPLLNSLAGLSTALTTVATSASGYATGCTGFFAQPGCTILGVWTYWAGTTAITLDCSLWVGSYAGGLTGYTKVANGSIAIAASSAGWYYVPFGTAYAVTGTGLGWTATVYESTGSILTAGGAITGPPTTGVPIQAGPFVWYTGWNINETNNTSAPNGSASNTTYPVEPVIVWTTTTTTSNYTQPAVGSSVTIAVTSATGFAAGQVLFVVNGGVYRIQSISGSNLVCFNVGDVTNSVASSTVVGSGAVVY